ncbi:probable 3-beta-hydroxysteroid-Delta(8),Delta(7)-isomerase [Spinacia oleracea]|uniref:Probable 3-beta-hydroxysteroid-Delta(8),Delta(7)-isomerase n=1 Tax=Spinacia oleracea TaxID=3562 RepID=A0A9R0J4K0_SPIOL|nr:probable 3-beta-hydroxysteroid-Delta(8),Delta(7)-isomerase [Spinacia oleracea]
MEGYHPYPPKHLNLSDFTPNLLSETTILGTFAAASIVLFCLTWFLSGLSSKTTKFEKLVIFWMTFNGLVHLTLEFYLVFKPEFYKDKTGSILAEIWKLYSKSDSRYLSLDSTTIALEGISIFILGPANLLAAYATTTQKSYRYPLQLSVSLGDLYGFVIYVMTAFLGGESFSASPYYFYVYFIGFNSPWVFVPLLIIIRSWRKICKLEGTNKRKLH